MQTMLPAKLRTYCLSFLTSVSIYAVSHMLHSYLLGVALIIHVASYLPVTGYDSLLTVFPAAVHMSVFLLFFVPGVCANICMLRAWNSFLFPDVRTPWQIGCHCAYVCVLKFIISLCTFQVCACDVLLMWISTCQGRSLWCFILVLSPQEDSLHILVCMCVAGSGVWTRLCAVVWHSVGD